MVQGLSAPQRLDAPGALQDLVSSRAAALEVPGAAVGVVWQGREHLVTTGSASVETGASVTEDTLFMIGSTTKTITATALLSLVDQKILDLDDPIRRHLPDLELADDRAARSLTLRHLLSHVGGFEGDVRDDHDAWGTTALADSIATFGQLTQHSPPGETFSYSNAGLRLAGRVLEVVTGQPFEHAVRDLVLEPLRMTHSCFLPWEAWSRPCAVGHVVEGSGTRVAHTWGLGRSAAPEGGLLSSLTDQVRYARYHLDGTTDGTAPLRDVTRRSMQAAQRGAAPPFDAVGLPWLLVDTHGIRALTHGGNIAGVQISALLLHPDRDLAVTVLTNGAPGRALGAEVTDWCLETLLGLSPDAPLTTGPLRPKELQECAGRYLCGSWGMDLDVEDGGLVADFFLTGERDGEAVLPPPQRLEFSATDEVMRPAAPHEIFGRFERDETGRVVRLLCQGRATHRVQEAR